MSGKINYMATDQIIPGHTAGNFYDLLYQQDVLIESNEFRKSEAVSLAGIRETMFLRTDEGWNVAASFILKADIPEWKEFFYSVKIGEIFTFYPDAALGGFACRMVTSTFEPIMLGTIDEYFTLPFEVIRVV